MLQFLTYLFIAIYTATVIGIILVVILGNRNPLKTIPWVVVLIFARSWDWFSISSSGRICGASGLFRAVPTSGSWSMLFRPMCVEAMPRSGRMSIPVHSAYQYFAGGFLYGSRLTHYGDGASKMTALLEEIEKARDHIHILYYIFVTMKRVPVFSRR